MTKDLAVVLWLLLTVLVVVFAVKAGSDLPDKGYELKFYSGKTTLYRVELSELKEKDGGERIVHLYALKEKTTPYAVTGHDYGSNGRWDRIFVRRSVENKYEMGVVSKGRVKWKPSLGKKGEIPNFSDKEERNVFQLLNKATDFFNEEHLVTTAEKLLK